MRNSLPLGRQQLCGGTRARDGRTRLPLSPQPRLAIAKASRQELSHGVHHFTLELYRDKIHMDHQKPLAALLTRFFRLDIPKFTRGRLFCQIVTPTVRAAEVRNAASLSKFRSTFHFFPTPHSPSVIHHSHSNTSQSHPRSASYILRLPATILRRLYRYHHLAVTRRDHPLPIAKSPHASKHLGSRPRRPS
jgi:hypothetical protein